MRLAGGCFLNCGVQYAAKNGYARNNSDNNWPLNAHLLLNKRHFLADFYSTFYRSHRRL
jgi:hypothetical protein